MHILKVYGPNLRGPFDSRFETHLLEDPVAQTEIAEGYLIVKLPAFDGRDEQEIHDHHGEVVRRIPGAKPRGPMTVTYPPGQWSKTVVFEKVDRHED